MSERLLESRISALRGQVRRLLVFHGLSWLIAGVVPLVLLAGLADWLFHLDVFVRLALLLALGAVALWVVFKLVLRPSDRAVRRPRHRAADRTALARAP